MDDEFGLGVVSLACDEVEDGEVRTATASLLALPGSPALDRLLGSVPQSGPSFDGGAAFANRRGRPLDRLGATYGFGRGELALAAGREFSPLGVTSSLAPRRPGAYLAAAGRWRLSGDAGGGSVEILLTRYDMRTTCAALAVAVAAAGLAGEGGPQATRTVALTLGAQEAIPAVGMRQGQHLTTLSFQDAAGTPRTIVEIKASTDAIEVARLASHPHVATLRTSGRREAEGNLVVFVDGIDTPVHLSVSPKAPPSLRVVVSIEGAGTGPVRPNPASDPGTAAGAPVASRGEMESIVRDYLLGHPEVIREALDPARQLVSRVEELRHEVVGAAGVPASGDLAGAVTVVEFFDYRCGYCKRSVDAIRKAIAQTGVRVELRDYPILGADSERASRIALAAGMQSRYEDAHFALMEHEGGFGDDAVAELASQLGIDAARLRTDMESAAVSERIEANRDLAPTRCHRDAGVPRRRATGGAGVAGCRECGPDRGDDRSRQLTRRR